MIVYSWALKLRYRNLLKHKYKLYGYMGPLGLLQNQHPGEFGIYLRLNKLQLGVGRTSKDPQKSRV